MYLQETLTTGRSAAAWRQLDHDSYGYAFLPFMKDKPFAAAMLSETLGATGRVHGPHLDWRSQSGLRSRTDPEIALAGPMPASVSQK